MLLLQSKHKFLFVSKHKRPEAVHDQLLTGCQTVTSVPGALCVICWQSDLLTHFKHASKQFNPWPAEQLTYISNSSIDTRGIARAWQQRHSPSPTVGARHFMQLPACLQEEPLPAEQHLCSCTDMLSTQDASCMVSVPEGIGSCSVAKPWQDKLVAGWSAAQPQLLLFKSSDSHMYCSWY